MSSSNVPQVAPTPSTTSNVLSMPETMEMALLDLNKRYAFVFQLDRVARIPTEHHPNLDLYYSSSFVSSLESTHFIERKSVARTWINWPNRRTAYQLVYAPGQPRFTSDGNLNTWIPSPIKPIKGDITLWLDYLDRVFASDPTYRDWFLAWLAYPIQHSGAKLHTAVVFWSEATATGKSMLGKIMSYIYGQQNYAQIDESTLHNTFNFWANGRQFVMGEEIKGSSSEKYADRLKAMITQQVIYVNIKNRAQFELRDCLNYYFTSNHPDAFYLDPNDRRFFVHNLGDKKYPADLYRDHFEPWALNGGYEAIRYYLEKEIDLSKPIVGGDPNTLDPHPFNPGAAAPQSNARKAMVIANRDDAEEWLDELLDDPLTALKGSPRTLATAPELYDFFLAARKHTRIPYKTFCARLRARLKAVYGDNRLTLSDGRKVKAYPLRNAYTEWANRPMAEIVFAYETQIE